MKLTTQQILDHAETLLRKRKTYHHGLSAMVADSIGKAYLDDGIPPFQAAVSILSNPDLPKILRKSFADSGLILEFDQKGDNDLFGNVDRVLGDAIIIGFSLLKSVAEERGIDTGPPKKKGFEDFGIQDPGL